jgi:uncharacterized protein (DUF2147 family)
VAQPNPTIIDKIIGVYWSPKNVKIEIYKKDDKYFVKSICSLTKRKDLKNLSTSLKERDLVSIELFTNFIYKDGTYEDDKIYYPESGKTYGCKINISGKSLKGRGYIGISLFGRIEIFE